MKQRKNRSTESGCIAGCDDLPLFPVTPKPSSGLPAPNLVPAEAADIRSSDYSDIIDRSSCIDSRMAVAMSYLGVTANVCRKSLRREKADSRTFVAAGVKVFRILIHG